MFAEDFTAFFSTAEFATSDILGGATVSGIFDNGYTELDFGGSASSPSYVLPTSSVPPSVVGMPLVHDTITYKVVESKPDGTGVTTLRLRT